MSAPAAAPTAAPARPLRPPDEPALGAAALAGGALAGLGVGIALYVYAPPPGLAVVAAIALLGVLALAIARYDAAVGLGVLLLCVVVADPAPSDVVFVVVMAVAAVSGRFRLRDAPTAIVVILGLLGALNLISAIDVADPERAALFFSITLYLALLGLWLSGYVRSRGRAGLVLRAYVAAAVISALLGVGALLAPLPGAESLTESDRARALFQDPNVFGPFLIPALLIVLEEILHPRLLRARTSVKALTVAVLALGVVFSYSRGAWGNLALGLLVMGFVLALRRGGLRQAMALLALAAVAAALVGGIVIATGSGDFLAERARPQAYDTERFGGQEAGLRSAEQHLFGSGPGSFESIAGISAHSTYARAAAEQGFPGLAVLLALLAVTLALAVGNAFNGQSTCGIGSAALLGAWCGMLLNSAFIDTLHWRHLWLVAGLIWAGAMLARRARYTSDGARTGVHAGRL